MNKEKYIEDLKDIKEMMSKSSKFISLSGLSGVFAGIFALIAAWIAYQTVYTSQDYFGYRVVYLDGESIIKLLLIAFVTLVLSLSSGIYFTSKESKKNNQKLWDENTKLLLVNLGIPLVTGGVLSLILLLKGYVGIIAPLTLIFYGLVLVNASKYTLGEIRSLGLLEISLGLLACNFIGYGLLFWSVGFGILHIIYGVAMHLKYKK